MHQNYVWVSLHWSGALFIPGAKCTAFIHFMATFIVFQVIFGILSIWLTKAAAAAAAAACRTRRRGNKRVTIVSVRLSLIMETPGTLSLGNASLPRPMLEHFSWLPCNVKRDSLINSTYLLWSSRRHSSSSSSDSSGCCQLQDAIATAIKICSYC